ncbi:hypothetical protein [Neisseria sp.]
MTRCNRPSENSGQSVSACTVLLKRQNAPPQNPLAARPTCPF